MNCRQLERYAIAYMDGKLGREKAEAVARHVEGCAVCAQRLRAFSDVSSLLEVWEPAEPSAYFNSRLRQRILAEPAAPAGWLDRFSLWLTVNSFGKPAMAGALLGMILMAVGVARYSPGTPLVEVPVTTNTAMLATTFEGNEELALYEDLPVLENFELLSNFEVLQELPASAQ